MNREDEENKNRRRETVLVVHMVNGGCAEQKGGVKEATRAKGNKRRTPKPSLEPYKQHLFYGAKF